MAHYSIAETKNNLSQLIDRAIEGEAVVITRHGKIVAEIRPPRTSGGRPMTAEDVAWLDQTRVGTRMPAEDAATLIRRLRDEGP